MDKSEPVRRFGFIRILSESSCVRISCSSLKILPIADAVGFFVFWHSVTVKNRPIYKTSHRRLAVAEEINSTQKSVSNTI